MNSTTHLEPLGNIRARQMFDLLRQASSDEHSATPWSSKATSSA